MANTRPKLCCVKPCKHFRDENKGGQELKDRYRDVECGRYLAHVQQNLGEERVHQAILKALDQLFLQLLLQTPVVAGQGSQYWVHRCLELRTSEFQWSVDIWNWMDGCE